MQIGRHGIPSGDAGRRASGDDDTSELAAYVVLGSAIVAFIWTLAALAAMEVALDVAIAGGVLAAILGAVLGSILTQRI